MAFDFKRRQFGQLPRLGVPDEGAAYAFQTGCPVFPSQSLDTNAESAAFQAANWSYPDLMTMQSDTWPHVRMRNSNHGQLRRKVDLSDPLPAGCRRFAAQMLPQIAVSMHRGHRGRRRFGNIRTLLTGILTWRNRPLL